MSSPLLPRLTSLRALGDEAAAFLLGARCAGCGQPGTLLCAPCVAALHPSLRTFRTPGGLPGIAALDFAGPAARCIRGLKEDGATGLARPLGAALRAAIEVAWRDVPTDTVLVPVPTARAAFRRRGYRVPELLVRRAGLAVVTVLAPGRRARDQRGLGRRERAENVRGSVRVRARSAPRTALLIDDVVTTGATFDEAVRVLAQAGWAVVGAVALAATPAS